MKDHGERPRELDADDLRFTERLAEAYAPEPLTAEQRGSFARALEARLERRHRRARLLPALSGVAAAAAVAWLVLPRQPAPESGGQVARPEASQAALEAGPVDWEVELLFPDTGSGDEWETRNDPLPDEYLAIASAFLDG